MSLPSFSLQSSWVLSDPCWCAQVSFYSCVFRVAWDCALFGELRRNPGYGVRDWKLVM